MVAVRVGKGGTGAKARLLAEYAELYGRCRWLDGLRCGRNI